TLRRVDEPSATPRHGRVLVGIPLLAGIVAFVIVGALAAVTVATVVALALTWRYGRICLALVALMLVAAACLGIVRIQHREQRPVSYGWTNGEETEDHLALVGLLLGGADPIVAAARRRVEAASGAAQTPG